MGEPGPRGPPGAVGDAGPPGPLVSVGNHFDFLYFPQSIAKIRGTTGNKAFPFVMRLCSAPQGRQRPEVQGIEAPQGLDGLGFPARGLAKFGPCGTLLCVIPDLFLFTF